MPDVAINENDVAAVTWRATNCGSDKMHLRLFDQDGVLTGVAGVGDGQSGTSPKLGIDNRNITLVVWANVLDSYTDVRYQYFKQAGAQLSGGGVLTANSLTTRWQALPDIAIRPTGESVIVWESDVGPEDPREVVARGLDGKEDED